MGTMINKKNFLSMVLGDKDTIINKIKGTFFGCAIGDALGMPIEFQKKSERDKIGLVTQMLHGGTLNGHDNFKELPEGTWTDDTSMMLCLAHSLFEKGFDYKDQIEKYEKWLNNGYLSCCEKSIGSGGATRIAIENFNKNGSIINGDNTTLGNGSLMRIAPIPIYFIDSPVDCAYFASESSKTTHNSNICKNFTMLYALAIRDAFLNVDKECIIPERYSFLNGCNELISDTMTVEELYEKQCSGNIVYSFYLAMECFNKTNDFKTGMIMAINKLGDSDTYGAIYGTLAGAYFGYNNIPNQWLKKLKHKELIEDICDKYINILT